MRPRYVFNRGLLVERVAHISISLGHSLDLRFGYAGLHPMRLLRHRAVLSTVVADISPVFIAFWSRPQARPYGRGPGTRTGPDPVAAFAGSS